MSLEEALKNPLRSSGVNLLELISAAGTAVAAAGFWSITVNVGTPVPTVCRNARREQPFVSVLGFFLAITMNLLIPKFQWSLPSLQYCTLAALLIPAGRGKTPYRGRPEGVAHR
jgi:hypothetical protein